MRPLPVTLQKNIIFLKIGKADTVAFSPRLVVPEVYLDLPPVEGRGVFGPNLTLL